MIEGTGIWMNNSMAYSTFEPKGNPMDAFPGRHKLSGDCPVIIIKDGRPYAALGSPGGHTITQNVPQIIFNLIDFKMSMQEAIDAPKIAFIEPNSIRVDQEIPESLTDLLKERGHQISRGSIGNATGIKIISDNKGKIISFDVGIDRRGEGRAAIVDH
jgi:gamma-glutamyltranspeptidase/glutathione hydrolase